MNSYERVLAAVKHQQPDRPPQALFSTDEVDASLMSHYGFDSYEEVLVELGIDFRTIQPEVNKSYPVPPHVVEKWQGKAEILTSYHGDVRIVSEEFPQAHRVYGPFYENDDLDSFDWPAVSDIDTVESLRPKFAEYNERGLFTFARAENPFKMGYFMRPFEDFLMDCAARPDYAFELMSRVADFETTVVENAVKAGARGAMVGGDFAHQEALMMSPPTFRKLLKPLLANFVTRVRAINPDVVTLLHSDGDLTEVLEDLIECGIDAIHPIQPECMDMFDVKRRLGDQMTIFGGVSVQSELPGSDPEYIRGLVRDRAKILGENGGFILAPTNTLLPDVPVESIVAMYSELR